MTSKATNRWGLIHVVAESDTEDHSRTTQLVRESLLAGVRYGKHGRSREGTR